MDVDPDQIGENELTLLKERLPQWALSVGVINRSVRDLEARLLTEERR